jgi:hypothetical protein
MISIKHILVPDAEIVLKCSMLFIMYFDNVMFIIGGVKDLKIYADLALLSVEGDEHVGRVTSLHSATIGYSPMIFRIEDINGEIEMMDRWNEVWESLEKDVGLPQKLVSSPIF